MMLTSRRALSPLFLVLLIPILGGSKCNKKKGVQDDLGGDAYNDGLGAQDIDVRLSVVSLSPSTTGVGTPLNATLRGSGFARGARVYIGTTPIDDLVWNSATSLSVGIPGMPRGRYDVEVVNTDGESSVLRQGLVVEDDAPACASVTVYFDTGEDVLRSDSLRLLQSQLDCYREHSGPMLVEGHCDERGTTDYNIALGERRADAVARWLSSNGLSRSRLSTLSYGEERPAVVGSDESAWSRNRRVEILLSR